MLKATDLRQRIMGCWLGKAVGGTLGQTFEGNLNLLDADFYRPVPTGMIPNDDLDLQVVHAVTIANLPSTRVNRHDLAEGWLRHVDFPWNEYGVGLRNLAEGLQPPHTGAYDNWFTCGEGAAIRSELWACLAAGNPDLAAAYAYEDACFDHAGDGVHAPMFLAAIQAAAFVEFDTDALLERALSVIPNDCGIANVVRDVRTWCGAEDATWQDVRWKILDKYFSDDFTNVVINTGFIINGWLMGTDFESRILICTNCGYDTDSSTASLASLLGILEPAAIPDRWLAPIGRELKLNDQIRDLAVPSTLDEFTDLVLDLHGRLDGNPPQVDDVSFDPASMELYVEVAHFRNEVAQHGPKDLPGVPLAFDGTPELPWEPLTLPGTWVRLPREDFRNELLAVKYQVTLDADLDVRIMLNCTEHNRLVVDGTFVHWAQGSTYMFPAPHMPPVGQAWDGELTAGVHEVIVIIRRPDEQGPRARDAAEWVFAVCERPSMQWLPRALRTHRRSAQELRDPSQQAE